MTDEVCRFAKTFQELGLSDESTAIKLSLEVENILTPKDSTEIPCSVKWHRISKDVLSPQIPFKIHEFLFALTYENSKEPNFIWSPTEKEIAATNIQHFIKKNNKKNLRQLFEWADINRELFWQSIVQTLKIQFHTQPSSVFDFSQGIEHPIYFPDCTLNACELILVGNDDRTAIVWSNDSYIDNGIIHTITLGQLKKEVNRISSAIVNKLHLKVGDAIAIDMPMNWESVAIYLGIIQAGLVVVSIADSFGADGIAIRLKIAEAKAIFTQDIILHGQRKLPLYQRVKDTNIEIPAVVLSCYGINGGLECDLREIDMSWKDFLHEADDTFDTVYVGSMHFANILFSSGTTGKPKAIPWHHSTFIKPLSDGYLHIDVVPDEVVAWPTNMGWMMGPWLVAMLGLQSTIALFVGSPVSAKFCKFVEIAKIAHLGVIPSLVKGWKKRNSTKDVDWSCVRRFSSTGEASNPSLYHWLVSRANYAPVMEYVGGTEIAGGYLSGTMIQPQILSAFSCPCLGLNIRINDEDGNLAKYEGELTICPPSIGLSVTLLNPIVNKVRSSQIPTGKPFCFYGMKFVITGELYEHCEDIINEYGGKVVKNVSGMVQYLIAGGNPDPIKVENAENKNIRIVKEFGFYELLKTLPEKIPHFVVYFENMPKLKNGQILRRHGDQLRIICDNRPNIESSESKVNGDIKDENSPILNCERYFQHLGRVDDTMNLSGVKTSSIAIENAVAGHPMISADCAAIAYRKQEIDSELLVICCVPKCKRDLIIVEFELHSQQLLGIQIAPMLNNNYISIVTKVGRTELLELYPDLLNCALYSVSDIIVYGRVQFAAVVKLLKTKRIIAVDDNREQTLKVIFVRQNFNILKIEKEIRSLVKSRLNPLFRVQELYLLDKLPRTASGKVKRRVLRDKYSKSFL